MNFRRLSRGEAIATASGVALFVITFVVWVDAEDGGENAWQLFQIIDIFYAVLALTPPVLAGLKAAGVQTPLQDSMRRILIPVGTVVVAPTVAFLLETPSLGLLLAALAGAGILFGGATTHAEEDDLGRRRPTSAPRIQPGELGKPTENRARRDPHLPAREAGGRAPSSELDPAEMPMTPADAEFNRTIFYFDSTGPRESCPRRSGAAYEPNEPQTPDSEHVTEAFPVPGTAPTPSPVEGEGDRRVFYTDTEPVLGESSPQDPRAVGGPDDQPSTGFDSRGRPQSGDGIDGLIKRAQSTGDTSGEVSPRRGFMEEIERVIGARDKLADQLDAGLEATTIVDTSSVLRLAREAASRLTQLEVRHHGAGSVVVGVRRGSRTIASFEVVAVSSENGETRTAVEWTSEMLEKMLEAGELAGWVEGLYWSWVKGIPGYGVYYEYLTLLESALRAEDPSARVNVKAKAPLQRAEASGTLGRRV